MKEAEQKVEAVEASLQKIAEARAARAARADGEGTRRGVLTLPGGASFSQGHRGLAVGCACAWMAVFPLPGVAPQGGLHGHRGLRVGCKAGAGGSPQVLLKSHESCLKRIARGGRLSSSSRGIVSALIRWPFCSRTLCRLLAHSPNQSLSLTFWVHPLVIRLVDRWCT